MTKWKLWDRIFFWTGVSFAVSLVGAMLGMPVWEQCLAAIGVMFVIIVAPFLWKLRREHWRNFKPSEAREALLKKAGWWVAHQQPIPPSDDGNQQGPGPFVETMSQREQRLLDGLGEQAWGVINQIHDPHRKVSTGPLYPVSTAAVSRLKDPRIEKLSPGEHIDVILAEKEQVVFWYLNLKDRNDALYRELEECRARKSAIEELTDLADRSLACADAGSASGPGRSRSAVQSKRWHSSEVLYLSGMRLRGVVLRSRAESAGVGSAQWLRRTTRSSGISLAQAVEACRISKCLSVSLRRRGAS